MFLNYAKVCSALSLSADLTKHLISNKYFFVVFNFLIYFFTSKGMAGALNVYMLVVTIRLMALSCIKLIQSR